MQLRREWLFELFDVFIYYEFIKKEEANMNIIETFTGCESFVWSILVHIKHWIYSLVRFPRTSGVMF